MTEPYIVTKCGHTFQKSSLLDWFNKKQNCPSFYGNRRSSTDKFINESNKKHNNKHKNYFLTNNLN